ncbi:uncharacterized protein JN550_004682 [Neoarthrinium moseri]|uniref:uncharacterized protein n=1 Tax=Neoarthrinium moseri TaxID=1658444 RepID=UPI001FDAE843|nr:uncharacterized protein JN550_004682 [Neoarthrinium moseri]KAI1871237.1 hypothetical protein JN550_004682 [Neoarthrinium moseri]
MAVSESINLVDASISDLKRALESGSLTSVELITRYLHRIAKYDMRGPVLNSIPVINPHVLEDAQASDDYRASGKTPRPLEGIPFTVKDSFRVKGMTVAAGSPAFADLVASDDCFIVQQLREAGAIVLGRTNMPAMADGGCQRGLYDRAESPYNPAFSTTAYASGSSNGCGTSTTASFAAFGFAGETVSSGRSPASNNALVGYSPSRGVIPIRGQWPLYPTCDVVVPHTKSLSDLFDVLNVIVADDADVRGLDFWRSQSHISIPAASSIRPTDFHSLEDAKALQGKRIAVPKCFLGVEGYGLTSMCSEEVLRLFRAALRDLEALGATVVETSFPLYAQYTKQDFPGQATNVPGLTNDWMSIERCQLIAMGWDDFLRDNKDPKHPDLPSVDPSKIHPHIAPLDDPSAHSEAQNQVRYPEMIDSVRVRNSTPSTLPGCAEALEALEAMTKKFYEDWMDENRYDLLAFPTNGDVVAADADENMESMIHALQDGIKYSNGGRALKHLGVPCITVPMGEIKDKKIPVGITFANKGWADSDLLRYAFAYETASKRRTSPPLAPSLPTDLIAIRGDSPAQNRGASQKALLKVESVTSDKEDAAEQHVRHVSIRGSVEFDDPVDTVSAYVDGEPVDNLLVDGSQWSFDGRIARPIRHDKYPTSVKLPRDHIMVTVIAKAANGRSAAQYIMVE